MRQNFLLTEKWWQDAAAVWPGASAHQRDLMGFTVKQVIDMASPANFLWTNPEVMARTAQTGGANLWQGLCNFIDDEKRLMTKALPPGAEAFEVGRDVAVTPGQVVYRNHLIELIQYNPVGAQTRPEPILIVPAWIMKYYILDLSPGNSLIKYLVDQGHTVFAISWLNPDSADRDLGMDDYLSLGVMDAINAVNAVVPTQKVHAVGYCLGGTLLAIAAAAMGRDGDTRLATVSLLAAQTDFSEPGELALFIDERQIAALEKSMSGKGYLDSAQMAGAFVLINSNDLLWTRMLKDYLLGERAPMSDLMAWNADGTRLPLRMHSEYLRRLFMNNELAKGRYLVKGQPVELSDVHCPIFCVGTVHDQVAPWRSVHKIHLLADTDVTFVLTSGGHNVGIVNPPGVPGRSYQALTRARDDRYLAPEAWLGAAPLHQGSWWRCWSAWLEERSGDLTQAPAMGAQGCAPTCPAPGLYVRQR
jgi:polyhydroxyalkanoate synthase